MGTVVQHPYFVSLLVNADKNATRDLLAAQGATTQIWVHAIHVSGNADGTVLFLDSTPTSRTGIIPVFVAGQQMIDWPFIADPETPYFKCATNKKLQVTLSANTDLDGVIIYQVRTVA